MSEKLLIVNADDYGLTPDVSRGIRYAHTHGVVTSTTALMNSSDIASDLNLAKHETPSLGLGVHLNLTLGKPLLLAKEIPSIVDQDGNFMSLGALKLNLSKINSNHVYAEWKAQIEKMLSLGINPDHLDSHHHVSFRSQALFDVMVQLANEYALPVRTSPAHLAGNCLQLNDQTNSVNGKRQPLHPKEVQIDFYDKGVTVQHLKDILHSLSPGIIELMVHPAFNSSSLHLLSSYIAHRELELEILTSPEIQKTIELLGIALATFKIFQS